MDIKNIDKAEELIGYYRDVMGSKVQLQHFIEDHDDKDDEVLLLINYQTDAEIKFKDLNAGLIDAIESVLNDRYDSIVHQLKQL